MPRTFVPRPRAGLAATAAIAATALAVSACGGSSKGNSTSSGSSAKSPSDSGSRVVQTVYGRVKVPVHATRIVALDFPEATPLADLDIKPVAIGSYIPPLTYYTTFFKGLPVVTNTYGVPNLEKVAAEKPDLIIGDTSIFEGAGAKSLYKQLSQIAPTIIGPWASAAGAWQQDAAMTAAAVGRTAQLNRLKQAYEVHAAEIKRKYAKVLATHTIDMVSASNGSNWYLYGPSSSHGKVLAAAGARFGLAATQKAGYVEYSTEKYDLLSKTSLIFVDATAPGDLGVAKNVTSDPVFSSTPAAKDGDVFTTPYFWPSSYRAANLLLDDFAAALQKVK